MKRFMMVLVAALVLMSAAVSSQVGVAFAQDCQAGANLNGNAMPNVINGGPQDNIIRGFAGDDILRGFGCNDHIYGDAGDDRIDGGDGYDWCFGGPGFDIFANCEVVVQ